MSTYFPFGKIFKLICIPIVFFSLLFLVSCLPEDEEDETVPEPTAQFSASSQNIKVGESVTFTNLTQESASLNWSFPGGSPSVSTSANPVVTYDEPGTYTVILTASNEGGFDTETKTDFISVTEDGSSATAAVAGFTASNDLIATGSSVTFTNTSTGAVSYSWSFAGGSPASSTATSPTVTYNSAGVYAVSLAATNSEGQTDTETKSSLITVYSPATAAFSASKTEVAKGQTVTFENQSSNATSYRWSFEGGTPATSTEANPTVTFNSRGKFDVSLEVSNDYSNDSQTKSEYINVKSYVAFMRIFFNGAVGFSYNGTGLSNTVTKEGPGVYSIVFRGVGAGPLGRSGDIQISANAGSRAFASINAISGGGDITISVRTYNTSGGGNDESFYIALNNNVPADGGFALIDSGYGVAYSYNSVTNQAGAVRSDVPSGGGAGRKEVIFAGLDMSGKNIQVTPFAGPMHAIIEETGSNSVKIATFDQQGNRANPSYAMVSVNAPTGKGAFGNFACCGQINQEYNATNSYNSSGGRNYVIQRSFGVYDIYFEGMNLNSPYSVQVTPIFRPISQARTATVQSVNTYSGGVVVRVIAVNGTGALDVSNLSVYLKYDD